MLSFPQESKQCGLYAAETGLVKENLQSQLVSLRIELSRPVKTKNHPLTRISRRNKITRTPIECEQNFSCAKYAFLRCPPALQYRPFRQARGTQPASLRGTRKITRTGTAVPADGCPTTPVDLEFLVHAAATHLPGRFFRLADNAEPASNGGACRHPRNRPIRTGIPPRREAPPG